MFDEQWRAVQREAQLAAQQLAYGVTVLRKANHSQTGYYTQAFFALSIGLERLGKLIFIADYAINSGGNFPTDKDLRNIGHDIQQLLPLCETIGNSLSPGRDFSIRPKDTIHKGIEEVLSLFATKLRYYNLNQLAGIAGSQQDPVALWWEKVATPILDQHYTKKQRSKDEADAAFLQYTLGDRAKVLHHNEIGESLGDMHTFFRHGRATGAHRLIL